MKTVVLDFETFYDADYTLRKLTYPEFILDPRFAVHGMAVDDGKTQHFYPPSQIKGVLKGLKDAVIIVHNAFFDAAILKWRYGFTPKVIVDTLALANHVFGSSRDGGGGGSDLDSLAHMLGFEPKNRTIDFKGLQTLTPEQFALVAIYANHDAHLTRQIYDNLVARIGNAEFELWLLNHTINIYTNKTLEVDPKKLEHTLKLVAKRRAEIVTASKVDPSVLSSNKQFGEELARRLKAAKIPMPMKRGKNGMIPALAKGDPEFIALTDSECPYVAALVRARLVERSATTVTARVRTMQKYHALGIGIPVHLVYYGAHTGRFAGGGGFNFQNLTSPARASDPLDKEIASSIREAIIPGKGRVFVEDDAAQIEARVEPWLAGEQSILDAFAAGTDVYSKFMSDVLKEDIHKPTKLDDPSTHGYLTLMRQAGKVAVLGLGFGMGVDKFIMRLRQEKSIVPHLAKGGKLDQKVCAAIVHGYRAQFPLIVQFWADLNNAFQAAIRGAKRSVGFLTFERVDGKDVAITLPSGRRLFYRNIRRVPRHGKTEYIGVDGKRHSQERDGFEWIHGNGQRIYGGLLAENVTQAVARDVLVETIFNAEQAGYPIVLHVHDSVVARVPVSKGPKALAFLDASLRDAPEWAPGLVLGSEGHIANNLGK